MKSDVTSDHACSDDFQQRVDPLSVASSRSFPSRFREPPCFFDAAIFVRPGSSALAFDERRRLLRLYYHAHIGH